METFLGRISGRRSWGGGGGGGGGIQLVKRWRVETVVQKFFWGESVDGEVL